MRIELLRHHHHRTTRKPKLKSARPVKAETNKKKTRKITLVARNAGKKAKKTRKAA